MDHDDVAELPSRRKAARRNVHVYGVVSTASGQSQKMRISDVSPFGCKLKASYDWMKLGAFISIKLDDAEPVQGIVRWSRDGATGIEFLRGLHVDSVAWARLIENNIGW